MTQTITPDFTALDFDTFRNEILSFIKANYPDIYDDFMQSDAGVITTGASAFADNFAIDRGENLTHETWLSTVVRRENALKIIKTLGQQPMLPKAARVPTKLYFETIPNVDVSVNALYSIEATGLDGSKKTFEMMNAPDDYYNAIRLPAGILEHNVTLYEGKTYQDVFQSDGSTRQKYTLLNSPIVHDSVRVSLSPISPDIIQAQDILSSRVSEVTSLETAVDEYYFVIDIADDNSVTVKFANDNFGKIPPRGWYIYIDYRVGGGTSGNISVSSISKNVAFSNILNQAVRAKLINSTSRGVGGTDSESIDSIKENAPARISTGGKISSRTDYETVLKQILPNVVDKVFVLDYQTNLTLAGTQNIVVPQNTNYLWILSKNGEALTEEQKQIIYTEIKNKNMIAIQNYLFDPDFVDWSVNATLYVNSSVDTEYVEKNIRNALLNLYGQTNLEGKLTGSLQFDRSIRRSQIIKIIQQYIGDSNYLELVEPTNDIVPYTSVPVHYGEVARLLNSNITLNFVLQ